jgi:RNA polymerase sigma-70 factor (ECF subfamily)
MEAEIQSDIAAGLLPAAFDKMVDHYQNQVFRLAYAMLHNETIAQDMAQEAFIKIWKALPNYRGDSSLSTWIYSITRNTCLTELKKRRDHPWDSMEEPAVCQRAEQALGEWETHVSVGREMDLTALLRRLPEKYRQVITLFYLEQKSYEEVAAMLGIPMGTVKTYLYRAKKELLAASRDPNPWCVSHA